MFDQNTITEARKNNDTASHASCSNVDLIEELVYEVKILENRLTGCESLYSSLDKATDTATLELRSILDEMIEYRNDNCSWTVGEYRVFSGIVTTLVTLQSIGYLDFLHYAVEAGERNIEKIEQWWLDSDSYFRG